MERPRLSRPIDVGPFQLVRVVGTGGMGQVFLGRHRSASFPVAVKVLTPQTSRNPKYQRYFKNEVRAVAGLSHPNIIRVFDYGQVDASTAEASEGSLEAGSPWLAMELATHGSLLDWRGHLDWGRLRDILVSLLDALAHAHARGVIHRDLKGANVLLSGDDRTVKLADFGLANPIFEVAEDDSVALRAVGTPWYMAPEQFAGSRRDHGPWTDLYALGCLGWVLVTGRPPYPGTSWSDTRELHLHAAPPPFSPRCPVPEGLEAWLHTLMEKRPRDRFRTAADAAWSLLQLSDASKGATVYVEAPSGGRTLPFSQPETPLAHSGHSFSFHTSDAEALPALPDFPRPAATRKWRLPPFPERWQQPSLGADGVPPGVGLGLYALRAIPLVDRESERDRLWFALRQVRERGRPAAELLIGPAGCGKSAIASWLVERAQEVGAAQNLRATWGTSAGPQDGLGPMLARHHRVLGLDRAEALAALHVELTELGLTDPDELRAAVAVTLPGGPEDEVGVRFETATARYVALQRVLERMCAERPVIVWLDDAHRSPDAIAFTRYFLDLPHQRPRPVLFVLTARTEDMPDHPLGEIGLQELLGHPCASRSEVQPLDRAWRSELVRQLLDLHPDLARRVEERTQGNPLFAVQMIGDLVQRGALVLGRSGFELAPGTHLDLPRSLTQIWHDRVERVLEGAPATWREALALAAVLGQDIDPLEWHAACARAGIEAPDELADALIVQRLARADEAGPEFGWGFVHGMLREAIERVASERAPEGWRAAHRLCADMLGETDAVGNAHRIGRHLLAAGDPAGALEPLLVASSSPGIDPRTAEAFLIERERAMDLLRLPADDPRRVANAIARAEVLLHQGREGNAAQYASEALELAEQHGWDGALAGALSALAEVARLKHRFGPSLQYRRRAARHAIAAGDVRREVEAISGIGRLYLDVGNWPQAQEAYTRALERAKEADLFAEAAECLTSLGYIATKTGDDDASEVRFKQAAWYVQRSGSQVQQGNLLNALADLARKRGAWAEAERHARESLRLYQATGTRAARVVALNLSLFQVLQGKYGTARLTIERALDDEASGPESAAFTAGCLAVLLPCLAAMAEWDAWYRHLDAIGRTFTGDLFVDDDTLAMLELAARLSTNNDDPDRPRAAWTLVWRLWRAMGRDDQAARVRAELDALLPRGAGS